ncbi:hypothetical protein ACFYPN_15780 [Streptomyces sp. NPDC005576]|uniref:hypothetical protein n=1 Tax=Streptomyces sp. NPDC005576 TaxID=3364726 RepID=UPI0036BD8042
MSTFATRLLTTAIEDAATVLRTAEALDVNDDLALVRSHTHLTSMLSRLLWVLDEDQDSVDLAADVPNEVAAEDGVRSIGVPYQRGPVAA